MSNPFEGLRVNPYVKTYVGSPIEELRTTLGALQTRHDQGLATMDQLARAYGAIKSVPGDQPWLKQYGDQLRQDIEEYSKAPEHSVAGIMSMARDFAINPQLQTVQQTYKNYMADIASAREKGVSPFQEQKITDALNRYTEAGGAESLQVFRQTPFYDELDMQGIADKAVSGINTEIEKGQFDEEGNLRGAYYTDEKGNRIQMKRTDTSPQRVAFIAASRLLQDPQTRRELIDRYRYNQNEAPKTPEDLQNWVEAKYVQPVVEKYAGTDISFSVSGSKGGSGTGGGALYDDFIFTSNQPSYLLKNAFDIDKFESFGTSGPYVFGLDQRVEKGGSSPAETYQIFNERQVMTDTIRKAFEEGRGSSFSSEQLSILKQFTDEEIRSLFYQDRDEFAEAQNVIGQLRDKLEANPNENYKELLEQHLRDIQRTGSYQGIALGPNEEEDISTDLTEYFAQMLKVSESPEQFFNIIENSSNYPMTANTGVRYNWNEVGNLLMSERFGLGQEQAKDLQDALQSFTSKTIFSQNLEDYITDVGISDISLTPQYVPASSVFAKVSKEGNVTVDTRAIDEAAMILKSFMLPDVNGNMRVGTVQAVDLEDGKIKDWKDIYDKISHPEYLKWDELELTQVGATNAPGMFEVTIPYDTSWGEGVGEAKFQVVLPDSSMANLSQGVAEKAKARLEADSENVDNPLLPVYIAHAFPSIVNGATANAVRNRTSGSQERLSFHGVYAIEQLLKVDEIIPMRNDSGRFYFEDEEDNNILNEEFGTMELAVNALLRRYFTLQAAKDAE